MRNRTWNYPHHDWYVYYLDFYAQSYPQDNFFTTAHVHPQGNADWEEVDSDLLPGHYGVNYIEIDQPQHTSFEISVEGDSMGNMGSYVDWRVGLVQEHISGDVTYYDLGTGARDRIEGIASTDTLTLMVMAVAPDAEFEEQFSYRYLWSKYESEPETPEHDTEDIEQPKSACSQLPLTDTMLWISGFLFVYNRRSRLT